MKLFKNLAITVISVLSFGFTVNAGGVMKNYKS